MIKNLDTLIVQITDKLESNKPVTSKDLDSVFPDSFFSNSEDPIRDIELAQKRIDEKLGNRNSNKFNDSYGKWAAKKLSAADLKPEVVSDEDHVTVNLKTPEDAKESMKVDVAGSRIKMNYEQQETRQQLQPDGSTAPASFTRRRQRIMAVPKGANPASYKVKAGKGTVSIIFDRLKKKHVEASK
jgi:HSP20 family molecular chaperone IbpA